MATSQQLIQDVVWKCLIHEQAKTLSFGKQLILSQRNPFFLTCLLCQFVGNIAGKGEIAHNEQFPLFPQCFLPVWRTLPFSSKLKLSSANSFSLGESTICRLGKGYSENFYSADVKKSLEEQCKEIAALRAQMLGEYEQLLTVRAEVMSSQSEEVGKLQQEMALIQQQYEDQMKSFQDKVKEQTGRFAVDFLAQVVYEYIPPNERVVTIESL